MGMCDFALTIEEVRSLRALHRSCRDRRLADRIKAIVLLGTGWTVSDTGEALMLDEDTVREYVQLYRRGGTDLLLSLHYQGSSPKLSSEQMDALDRHLSQTTYLRVQDIVAYVESTFGVVYTIQGMTDLLDKAIEAAKSYEPINKAEVKELQAAAESCESLFRKEEVARGGAPSGPVYPDSPHECCCAYA